MSKDWGLWTWNVENCCAFTLLDYIVWYVTRNLNIRQNPISLHQWWIQFSSVYYTGVPCFTRTWNLVNNSGLFQHLFLIFHSDELVIDIRCQLHFFFFPHFFYHIFWDWYRIVGSIKTYERARRLFSTKQLRLTNAGFENFWFDFEKNWSSTKFDDQLWVLTRFRLLSIFQIC